MLRRRCISENLLDATDNDFPSASLEDYVRMNAVPGFATVFRPSTGDSRRMGRSIARWQEVYIHSVERVTNAVAEEASFGEGRRRTRAKRRRFLIPLGYSGWFEVLSQDGRSTRPIVSVIELSRLGHNTSCLVREAISGFRRTEDGIYVAQPVRKGQLLRPQETDASRELLRCIDQRGDDVYLALDGRGLFSPVASPSSIAGAHDIRSLLEKFRLPITVRLLHGDIYSLDDADRHAGVFKLLAVRSEEVANVLSLDATDRSDLECWELVPVPTRQRDLVARPVTDEWRKTNDELLSFLRRRCQCLVDTRADTIRPETLHDGHWLMEGLELDFKDLAPARMDLSETESEDSVFPISQTSKEEEELFREIEDLYASARFPRGSLGHPQNDTLLRLPDRFDTTAAFFHCSRATRAPFPSKRPAFHANWKLQQRHNSTEDSFLPKRDALPRHQPSDTGPYRKAAPPTPIGWAVSRNRLAPTMRLTARVKPMPICLPKLGDVVTRRLIQDNHIYEKNHFSSTAAGNRGTSAAAIARLKADLSDESDSNDQMRRMKEEARVIQSSRNSLQKMSYNAHLSTVHSPIDSVTTKRCGGSLADLTSDGEGRIQIDSSQRSLWSAVPASPSRPTLLRPSSYAGTAPADPLPTKLHGRAPPPPLPPKRVASLSNLTQSHDLAYRRSPLMSSVQRSINQHPSNITRHLATPSECNMNCLAPHSECNAATINGRPTATIMGTVSRTLARTLRRVGTKSSGSFDLCSFDDGDDRSPRELWKRNDPYGSPPGLPQSPTSPLHHRSKMTILVPANGALLSC